MKEMREMKEMKENKGKKLNNKGFSLVELIVVIAIMAILTVVIAPQFMRYIEKSRESVDMQTLDNIQSAIQATLADEAAWDAVDATAGGQVVFTSAKFEYTGLGAAFTDELNKNYPNKPKLKSKKYKDGVTFTINIDKQVSYAPNTAPAAPSTP